MTVSSKDEFSAVFVALPFRDDFDIDTLLDGAGDEHATKGPLAIGRNPIRPANRL